MMVLLFPANKVSNGCFVKKHFRVVIANRQAVFSRYNSRLYASIKKDPDENQDYEIDLITLKKRYKHPKKVSAKTPDSTHQQGLHEFEREFKRELDALYSFFKTSPILNNVVCNASKLNSPVIQSVLMRFKTAFFREYLSNEAKYDVTKISQMCNYLQKNESLFIKLFTKDSATPIVIEDRSGSDKDIEDILKVFDKPLDKRRRKEVERPLKTESNAQKTSFSDNESTTICLPELKDFFPEKPKAAHLQEMTVNDNESTTIRLPNLKSFFPERQGAAALPLETAVNGDESTTIRLPDLKSFFPENPKLVSKLKDTGKEEQPDYASAAKLAKLTKKMDPASRLENEIKSRSIHPSHSEGIESTLLDKIIYSVTDTSSSGSVEPKGAENRPHEDPALQHLTASDIRNKYSKLYMSKPERKETAEKQSGKNFKKQETLESIEDFLKKAKQTSDLSKEETFRRQKAYEWSKSQLSDNVLENGKFFSPRMIPGTLIPFNILNPFNKPTNDLLFPSLNAKQDREYLLLTSTGKTINCGQENPLGFNYLPRDVFSILSNLQKPEDFIKYIRRLSKKNWKLIAGNDSNILIFARSSKPKYLRKIFVNIFTFIGMLSTALIAGSFFIEDKDLQLRNAKKIVSEAYTDSSSVTVGKST